MAAVRSTVTVARGETVTVVRDGYLDDSTVYEYQPFAPGAAPMSFFNYGTIEFIADFPINPDAWLVTFSSGLPQGSVVENHGAITVHAKIGYAIGFAGSSNAPFTNTGQITIRAQLEANGLLSWTAPVTNTGNILVEAGDMARALHLGGGGLIRNTGDIVADVTGGGEAYAIQLLRSDFRIENDGLIAATHSAGSGRSIAINFTGVGPTPSVIVNRGTITGDDALLDGVALSDATFKSSQQVANAGTINGRILLGIDADTLTNTGLVNGSVDLGSGDDVYDGQLGRAVGMVAAGDGADTLQGGAEFDYLHGNAGADSISGGGGGDWVVGGKDGDSLAGGAGDDVVYGNLGADTGLGGDGADWVRGGQDNDSLDGGAGDDLIWGDRGDDTISGGAGADTFSVFVGGGLERILDFSLSDGDRVRIEGAAPYAVRLQGADTLVDLGGGDLVVLVGVDLTASSGWIVSA